MSKRGPFPCSDLTGEKPAGKASLGTVTFLEGKGSTPTAEGGGVLPCLSSNNCTENLCPTSAKLTSGHKKTAHLLRLAVEKLAMDYGIEHIGFLTLTFSEHITDGKEAQKRWHSLRTHVLKPRYSKIIRVIERQKSGRIHYHLVVVLSDDIRTGADFEEFGKRCYGSANAALKGEWAFWRETAPRFGFGRTELLPVKSNADGISKYVGKYISKHIGQREERDKGMRLVEYTRGARVGSTSFAWNTPLAALWRAKVASFAARHGCATYQDLVGLFGPRWAFHHEASILRADWSMMIPNAAFAVRVGVPVDVASVAVFPQRMSVSGSLDGVPWARPVASGSVGWCDSPGQSFPPACVLNQEACGDVVDASLCGNEGARMVPPEPSRRRVTAGGTETRNKSKLGPPEALRQENEASRFRWRVGRVGEFHQRPLKL